MKGSGPALWQPQALSQRLFLCILKFAPFFKKRGAESNRPTRRLLCTLKERSERLLTLKTVLKPASGTQGWMMLLVLVKRFLEIVQLNQQLYAGAISNSSHSKFKWWHLRPFVFDLSSQGRVKQRVLYFSLTHSPKYLE